MEADTGVDKRGLGEIIDEACTLGLKISHGIKEEESVARLEKILLYLEKMSGKQEIAIAFTLLLVNASCWLCQDMVVKPGLPDLHVGTVAKVAQTLNKERNKLIGVLNGNTGIITEKSY